MEITFQEQNAVSVICIAGSVDSMTAGVLMDQLQSHVEGGHVHLVADFSDVQYTSSAGLRALLATVKQTRRHGGDLRLAQVQPSVLKVLELSGFTSILQLFEDVSAAVQSYAGA